MRMYDGQIGSAGNSFTYSRKNCSSSLQFPKDRSREITCDHCYPNNKAKDIIRKL